MKIPCPHCNQRIDVPGEYYGTQVSCPTCGGEFRVPEVESPTIAKEAKHIALPQEVTNTISPPSESTDLTRQHLEHITLKQGKWCDACSLVVPVGFETCLKCGQEALATAIAYRVNFERLALVAFPFLVGALLSPLFGPQAFKVGAIIGFWPVMIDVGVFAIQSMTCVSAANLQAHTEFAFCWPRVRTRPPLGLNTFLVGVTLAGSWLFCWSKP